MPQTKTEGEHSSESPVSVHDLTVAYHRKPVLWDVDLDIPSGKLVAIVGPNGAGKSTLIKAILDLVPIASGLISIFGKSFRKQRQRVAYVPQRESVDWDFPIDAIGVVTMGRYRKIGWCRPVRKLDKKKAMEALERVGMEEYADRQISQLSGGQQQRAAIARALVTNPSILLADEPTGNLDSKTGNDILQLFDEMNADGLTIMVVTHDEEVGKRCNRTIQLLDGLIDRDTKNA